MLLLQLRKDVSRLQVVVIVGVAVVGVVVVGVVVVGVVVVGVVVVLLLLLLVLCYYCCLEGLLDGTFLACHIHFLQPTYSVLAPHNSNPDILTKILIIQQFELSVLYL